MSYTVLARKWRPRQFAQMIGQEHVLRALINALDGNRLHHAYLFTGTRGIGKTTVARVLAKALNCETGVSSTPCGECAACTEIDEGRFVDLIEVDAASRTKVDDTRELLDNVQYAPTRGRYKVYLIDEVHMLSSHSFNALLKTLEEPPPHVKFLLATTDPQKLPVTVLSRCLQFNLKRLQPEALVAHLDHLCAEEGIGHEPGALERIALAAGGSVRDSLSLLDQAIAYGAGKLTDAEVADMLGTLDGERILEIIEALAEGDGARLLALVATLDERAPDYAAALQEVASLLQRVAVLQLVEGYLEEGPDAERLRALAAAMPVEDVQLYYQIAILGTRELNLAVHQRRAFEMNLLRMLAFRPGAEPPADASPPRRAAKKTPRATSAVAERGAAASRQEKATPKTATHEKATRETARHATAAHQGETDWASLVKASGLRGAALQLASHCALLRRDGHVWHLALDAGGELMNTDKIRATLQDALAAHLGTRVELRIDDSAPASETPAKERARAREEQLRAAQASMEADPNVKALQETFGAHLHLDTVQPLGPRNND